MAFNLDTNILLQGRGADIAGSIGRGLEARSMFDQLQMQREQAPIRQQLLEGQLAEAQQLQQQNQAILAQSEQNRVIDSIANTYSGVKSLVDTGKFNDAADALEANKEVLRQSGIANFEDSDLAINALRSGDAKAIRQIQLQGEQAIQMSEARRGAESSERFSPTTTALPGGISIQTTSTGRKVVTDAGGNVLTGQAATDAIVEAEEAKTQRAIAEAGGKRGAIIDAESGRTDIIAASKSAIASAVELAKESASLKGETLTGLQIAKASLPAVLDVVSQLKELAPVATNTLGGKVFDTASKELGFGATEGSTARAKFSSIVNNQILPLLKQTFGGAFTEAESDSLKATLGDVDASPTEKIAQLNAFIDGKIREIQTKERQLGQTVTPSSSLLSPEKSARLDELRKRNNL